VVREVFRKSTIDYLGIGNALLTPNSPPPGGTGITTGLITATSLLNWLKFAAAKELIINFTVQSVAGTNPTLQFQFFVLDPIESSNGISTSNPPLISLTLNQSAFATAPHTVRLVINDQGATVWIDGTAVSLGIMGVPSAWQLNLVVGGTYAGGQGWGVVGTYEVKR
jgi:hypothetical protein